MSVKTEILSAQKIKQSNIETKIYDKDAQFYEYNESVEKKLKDETNGRSSKRIVWTGTLIALGGFCLFSILAAAFYYFSEGIFHTTTVNQVGAKNLQNDESDDNSFGESGNAQNGFESEKSVKPNLSDDKNSSDNFVRKETLNQPEEKTVKITGQKDKILLPNRNSKKLPNTIDSTSKTTNSNFPKQVVQNDSRRDVWTSSLLNKNSQSQQTSRQNQRDSPTPNNSDGFQDLPKNRQEYIVKKIKQSSPEPRSKIKNALQKQRRKN